MLKPINSIIKDSIGNIIYRGNVVTGTVAVDNGNGSYDVFISESDIAYPKIFTLSANPDLAVGDKVRILYKNGCKELPIILPPTKATAATAPPELNYIAYLHYSGSTHYLTILDLDGNVLYTGIHSATAYSTNNNPITVDSDGNSYIIGRYADRIKKIDKDGNFVKLYYLDNGYQIAINPDGDLWTYGYLTAPTLRKIDPNTLQTIDTFDAGVVGDFTGMAFDSSGYLYMINWSEKRIEKWDVVNKIRIAYRALPVGDLADRAIYSSLAVVSSTVYLTQWANDEGDIWTCPTDLNSDFVANNVDEDFPAANDYCNFITASQGTHIIVEGYVSNVKTIVKYDTSFTKVWKITITDSGSGLGIGAYPF